MSVTFKLRATFALSSAAQSSTVSKTKTPLPTVDKQHPQLRSSAATDIVHHSRTGTGSLMPLIINGPNAEQAKHERRRGDLASQVTRWPGVTDVGVINNSVGPMSLTVEFSEYLPTESTIDFLRLSVSRSREVG